MKNIEVELKLELNQDIYKEILKFENASEPEKQINIFFDSTAHLLLDNKWALRLRLQGDKRILTCKGPAKKKKGIYSRKEYEEEIDDSNKLIKGNFKLSDFNYKPCVKLKEKFGDLLVNEIFQFINYRCIINYKDLIIELDKTIIKDRIYYELELESSKKEIKKHKKKIKKLFKKQKWEYLPSKYGKMAKAVKLFLNKENTA